jgi:hypothetical protein
MPTLFDKQGEEYSVSAGMLHGSGISSTQAAAMEATVWMQGYPTPPILTAPMVAAAASSKCCCTLS